jgi:hypothetical protein
MREGVILSVSKCGDVSVRSHSSRMTNCTWCRMVYSSATIAPGIALELPPTEEIHRRPDPSLLLLLLATGVAYPPSVAGEKPEVTPRYASGADGATAPIALGGGASLSHARTNRGQPPHRKRCTRRPVEPSSGRSCCVSAAVFLALSSLPACGVCLEMQEKIRKTYHARSINIHPYPSILRFFFGSPPSGRLPPPERPIA